MYKFTLKIILFFSIFVGLMNSQEKPIFYFGPYIGYGLNSHSADFNKLKEIPNCCPKFESGSGSGLSYGIFVELPASDKIGVILRAGYADLSGKFNPTQVIGNTEIRKTVPPYDNDGIADVISQFNLETVIPAITIEPQLSWYFARSITLDIGLRAGFLMDPKFSQEEVLISPDFVVFKENEQKIRNKVENETIEPLTSFQLSGMLGASYKLPIGEYSDLSLDLKYFFPFTNVIDEDWKISTLYAGISLKLPYMKSKEIKEYKEIRINRDTIITNTIAVKEPEVKLISRDSIISYNRTENSTTEIRTYNEKYELKMPKNAALSAEIKVTGITKEGKRQENPTIIIEETETEEGFPILPHIFFPDGSSDITKSTLNLLSKEETMKFKENGLEWETLNIYKDMLNVIAYRMKQNPKSKITITGNNNNTTTAEKGNMKLSEERAVAVRKYFTDIWEINPNRIEIAKRNLPLNPANNQREDGWIENSRAEISSNDLEIMKPVYLKEIAVTSNPPVIELLPIIQAEAGVKNWEININQKDSKLRNYTGNQVPESLYWKIEEEPMPKIEAPISIKLSATDKTESKIQAEKNLKLEQLTIKKKRYELKDDKRVERFSLIVFDFNKADLKQIHLNILNDIKSRIKPNSKVIIMGYADRSGESEYNKELAAKRTAEVQRILKVAPENLTIKNIGSDELIYDNYSPQGRSYCRTVKIFVETPVTE